MITTNKGVIRVCDDYHINLLHPNKAPLFPQGSATDHFTKTTMWNWHNFINHQCQPTSMSTKELSREPSHECTVGLLTQTGTDGHRLLNSEPVYRALLCHSVPVLSGGHQGGAGAPHAGAPTSFSRITGPFNPTRWCSLNMQRREAHGEGAPPWLVLCSVWSC